jgi:hypothetical protein
VYTPWIRPSTGRLCIELTAPESYLPESDLVGLLSASSRPSRTSLFEPPDNLDSITSLSLQDYGDICYLQLCRWHELSISTHVPVNVGSIRCVTGPEYENSREIASIPQSGLCDYGWESSSPMIEGAWFPYAPSFHPTRTHDSISRTQNETLIMENGWIRCVFYSSAQHFAHK